MSEVAKLLDANRRYASAHTEIADTNPSRRLAVVTCMDARIDVFAALGLHLGEAHVLRNAGGRVTDDVLRSLALSCHVLGVETVVVMQHTHCGLAGVTDEQLHQRTGADLGFFPIDDHAEALAEDVDLLIATPYLAPLRMIAGAVFDVETGEIRDVTDGNATADAATPACEDDAVMTADDVLHVVRIVREAGVTVWLDGGWGIDALLGAQFRRHEDLDVVVPLADVDTMTGRARRVRLRGRGGPPADPPRAPHVDRAAGRRASRDVRRRGHRLAGGGTPGRRRLRVPRRGLRRGHRRRDRGGMPLRRGAARAPPRLPAAGPRPGRHGTARGPPRPGPAAPLRLRGDELQVELDLDLVAEHQLLGAGDDAEVDPEVAAPDLAGGREAGVVLWSPGNTSVPLNSTSSVTGLVMPAIVRSPASS